MARCYRKNSLVIDFTSVPAKISLEQVRSFVFDKLELNISQVKNLQLSMTNARVFLEMATTEQAEALVILHNQQHSLDADGQDYPIPMYMADGSVEVKVYDLPPYLPNGTIAKHLSSYGEVISIKDDVWQKFFPGVPNGTRTVRMKLKKSIPSYVTMEDECAYIKYRNQTATCRYCGRNLHIGSKCSDVKKALSGNEGTGLTLAQIVDGRNPVLPNDNIAPLLPTIPDGPPSPLNLENLLATSSLPSNNSNSSKDNSPSIDNNLSEISDEDNQLSDTSIEATENSDSDIKDPKDGRKKRPSSPKSKKHKRSSSVNKKKSKSS